MTTNTIGRDYGLFAPLYDLLCGLALQPGRRNALRLLECQSGDRILEVGVGTGLSLPAYPRDVRVVGIDLSEGMLAKAAARVVRNGFAHVDGLLTMDGEHMRFADDSFDKVVAMYVVSVTPNPLRLIAEMQRVCKPGGTIVVVNHFRADSWYARVVEHVLWPLQRLYHFRPDIELGDFISRSGLEVRDIRRANLFRYSTIVSARNRKQAAKDTA